MKTVCILMSALMLLASASGVYADHRDACTPAYVVLEKLVIPVGAWDLSFNLLAVGCKETLAQAWPPKREVLEKEFALDLQETHPIQTLSMIDKRSPALRKTLVKRINKVLGRTVVQDLFLFDAKAAE